MFWDRADLIRRAEQLRVPDKALSWILFHDRYIWEYFVNWHNISGIDLPTSPYSHVVEADGLVCLSGQVASDSAFGRGGLGDAAAEIRAVMEHLRMGLAVVGLSFDDVVRVDMFVTDLDDMRIVDPIYGGYFKPGRLPARTCIEVRRLFGDSRIEVTMMARRAGLGRPA